MRLDADAFHNIDDYERAVAESGSRRDFRAEVDVAGRIYEVDQNACTPGIDCASKQLLEDDKLRPSVVLSWSM